jgi:hypothetical protein
MEGLSGPRIHTTTERTARGARGEPRGGEGMSGGFPFRKEDTPRPARRPAPGASPSAPPSSTRSLTGLMVRFVPRKVIARQGPALVLPGGKGRLRDQTFHLSETHTLPHTTNRLLAISTPPPNCRRIQSINHKPTRHHHNLPSIYTEFPHNHLILTGWSCFFSDDIFSVLLCKVRKNYF